MALPQGNTTLQRLRNRYRLVLLNEDTFEEIVAFKLSRISVYITLCTLFVVLVGLTVALIMFTPLKLYIPGYGEAQKAKEYELLELFLRHPKQVLTREVIFDRVWGYDFGGESNVLEVYIRYLRQKLEGEGEQRLIHTVRGVGYVLRENP